jgi:hypothetical protein
VVYAHRFPGVVLSTRVPVFNRQIRPALPALLRLSACFFFFSSLFFTHAAPPADPLEDATRALARKVATALHGGVVSLTQQNLSSLNGTEFSHLNDIFQEELQTRGVKISHNQSGIKVVFTIASSLNGYMGVAQIERSDGSTTEMEPLGPAVDFSPNEISSGITLHKEFLFAQDWPILDVAFSSDRKSAYALGRQEISAYARKGDQWESAGVERLPVHLPLSRDLRGLLSFGADTNAAYLPGELCRISFNEHKGWGCVPFHEQMPVRSFDPDSLAGKKAPWVSAARFEADGGTRAILTGKDGLARLYTNGPDPVAAIPDWGTEIASVKSGCGAAWQILATGKNDWTAGDTIQAFEIKDHAPRVVSQSVDFTGPVIALHNPSSWNSTDKFDTQDAVAIVHNLQSGRYEAYRLTVTCAE